MRDPDLIMIPFEEAERLVDAACRGCVLPSERVPVREATGRVLRAEARSKLALPSFDKSAVDGYALGEAPGDEHTTAYRVAGVIHAGDPPGAPIEPGMAVKVMTGAPVPLGTRRVVMVEHAERNGEVVRVARDDGAMNFCRRGEDLQPGDLVLPSGASLQAVDLGNLIGAGLTEVEMSRRVRVAVLSTGDEIVDDPAEIAPGRIMNSNGPMLAALARTHGLDLSREARVPDDPSATRAALASTLAEADLVLVSGGVSEGDSDFVAPALDALGLSTHFTRVAVKPGKPLTFASSGARFVLGLPGNPVSAYLMFHLFGLRVAAHLAGTDPKSRTMRLPLAAPFRRGKASRLEFVPARIAASGRLTAIRLHGSAHLQALAEADGFFRVPVGVNDIAAGEEALFHPIGRRLAP